MPLVGLLAVTGFGVYSGARQSEDAAALKSRTDMAMTAYGLADELQLQRASLVEGKGTTSESRARVERATESIANDVKSMDPALQRMADTTLRWVTGAGAVAETGLGGDAAISSISPAINSVLDLATAAIDPGGHIDSAPASTADNLARAQAASSEEADRLVMLAQRDEVSPAEF
ncbi:MAG TPA: hypothetical protein VL068_05160, partial [Microthrixaceae bacterium]|nr:hypothetical protein [Microthrixaceae bacterium]